MGFTKNNISIDLLRGFVVSFPNTDGIDTQGNENTEMLISFQLRLSIGIR